MKKNVFGRKLKRDTNERKALFKGLMSSLVLEERIKTTEEKAKSIKGQIEKLVTKVKKNNKIAAKLGQYLTDGAMKKMAVDIAPRFLARNGGYTRIIHMDNRFSDNASMVIMEWVEQAQSSNVKSQNEEKQDELVAPKKVAKKPETKKVKPTAAKRKKSK